MIKNLFFVSLLLIFSCSSDKQNSDSDANNSIVFDDAETIKNYSNLIMADALKTHVYTLASDQFEGRATGSIGFDKASDFVRSYYKDMGINPPSSNPDYYQKIPQGYFSSAIPPSQNVVAYIEGSEKPEEVIIISAHLDHMGTKNDLIYYGADDNASGTAAVMEIAKAFAMAKKEGHGPKRSLLFLHLTAEELGLYGSQYYVDKPIFPLDKTIANLNIDMIGRVDPSHQFKKQENYVYLIGADRLSTRLHDISEAANKKFTNLILDYTYNAENDKNRYYYRSDHYNFALQNIPVIFYNNGEHPDYHKPSDTPDKINYPILQKRTQLIFCTAWYLASMPDRLPLNEPTQ